MRSGQKRGQRAGGRQRKRQGHLAPAQAGEKAPSDPLSDGAAVRTAAAVATAAAPPTREESAAAAPAWLDYLLPGALCVMALVLFLPRLGTPREYIQDEVYHAYTAAQYLQGNADAYLWNTTAPPGVAYEWTHPPLGKLLIAAGVALFGDNAFGWRYASALFGTIGLAIAYGLGLRLTRRRAIAVLGAALLLADGLYFVQSRTGMPDIFVLVFMTGALVAFYGYLTAPPGGVRWPMVRTGVLLGLAIATKWNAAYASALIALVVLWRLYRLWWARRWLSPRRGELPAGVREHLLWLPLGLVALPLAIYALSYVPFFLTGHSVSQFTELQRQMYYYHTHLKETHAYQSQWWSWPLALRPVWYYTTRSGDLVANVYANGNPLLYWAFLPAVVWVGRRWWGERNAALIVLATGFFGQWLPWALSPRISFVYHFLPAVPFGCLAVATALLELWGKHGRWRAVAIGYAALVAFAFAFFFPIYAAVPQTAARFDLRLWLPSWR